MPPVRARLSSHSLTRNRQTGPPPFYGNSPVVLPSPNPPFLKTSSSLASTPSKAQPSLQATTHVSKRRKAHVPRSGLTARYAKRSEMSARRETVYTRERTDTTQSTSAWQENGSTIRWWSPNVHTHAPLLRQLNPALIYGDSPPGTKASAKPWSLPSRTPPQAPSFQSGFPPHQTRPSSWPSHGSPTMHPKRRTSLTTFLPNPLENLYLYPTRRSSTPYPNALATTPLEYPASCIMSGNGSPQPPPTS